MPTSSAKKPNTTKTSTKTTTKKPPASTGNGQRSRPAPPPRTQVNRSSIATTTPLYEEPGVYVDDPNDQPLLFAPSQARPVTNSTPTGAIHTAAARLAGDESLRSKASDPDPAWDDDDFVCVTIGYGANDENSQGFWVDATRFDKSRVARDVPFAAARAMQRAFAPKKKGLANPVRIHPNDATVPEIARRCGVRPGDPVKLAAQLLAAINQDPDAVLNQFGEDDLLFLAERIGAKALQVRAAAGR